MSQDFDQVPLRSEHGVTEGQPVRLRESKEIAVVQYSEEGVSHPEMGRRHWHIHLLGGGLRWFSSAEEIKSACIRLKAVRW